MSEYGEPWYFDEPTGILYNRKDDELSPGVCDAAADRIVLCVNALAGLSEEQINAINWDKVPALLDTYRRLFFPPPGTVMTTILGLLNELTAALAAVERK